MSAASLKATLKRVERAIAKGAEEGVDETTHHGELWVKTQIVSGQKSGRTYGNHKSSAAGEIPANWTGALVRGIKRKRKGPADYEVISTAEHSKWLEYGTEHMAKRPFMQPMADEMKDEMPDIVRDAIAKALRAV